MGEEPPCTPTRQWGNSSLAYLFELHQLHQLALYTDISLGCFPLAGEIVRSELGGHDTPTLVSFKLRERLVGESAVATVTSSPKGTIGAVHTMAGTPYRCRPLSSLLLSTQK